MNICNLPLAVITNFLCLPSGHTTQCHGTERQHSSIPPDSDCNDRQDSNEGREKQNEHEERCHLSSSPGFARRLAIPHQTDLVRDEGTYTWNSITCHFHCIWVNPAETAGGNCWKSISQGFPSTSFIRTWQISCSFRKLQEYSLPITKRWYEVLMGFTELWQAVCFWSTHKSSHSSVKFESVLLVITMFFYI